MKNILVVDDAATVRMYHRKMLGDAGWHVEEAANGLEALERVMNQPPDQPFDLYVVDVNMPRMDGYTFVQELRRQLRGAQVPVLMVSTEAQPQDAEAAEAAGANGYLVKPTRPPGLVLTAALMLGDVEVARRAAESQSLQGARA